MALRLPLVARAVAGARPGLALALVGATVAACGSSDGETRNGDTGSFVRLLERQMPDLLEEHGVPGAAVALVRGGKIARVAGFGMADRERGVPVTAATVFQVGSISKSVTAWGVMRLVEQGKLGLDVPVERYLRRWHLPASRFARNGVTVRRLLSHTAGLSLHGYPGFPPGTRLPTLEQSLSGATGGAGDVRLVQKPGSGFRYSGGGYTLLQLLVEEVTGKPFADYMERAILAPLLMQRSAFAWRPRLRASTATGYGPAGTRYPNYLFTEAAAAGLYTTAGDLARFVAALMWGPNGEPPGRGVLRQRTVALMLAPAPSTDGSYGLGFHRWLGDAFALRPGELGLISHGGSNFGWKASFVALPRQSDGLVTLTNSDSGFELINGLICSWLAWSTGRSRDQVCA